VSRWLLGGEKRGRTDNRVVPVRKTQKKKRYVIQGGEGKGPFEGTQKSRGGSRSMYRGGDVKGGRSHLEGDTRQATGREYHYVVVFLGISAK